MKKGIKYITNSGSQLNYDVPYIYQKERQIHQRKGKLRFWLIPQLNDLTDFSVVQDYLRRPEKGLSSFKSLFELSRDMRSVQKLRAQKLDRTVLSDGNKIMNLLTFTVLFYTYDKFQHMRLIEAVDGVYPRRLEELAQYKWEEATRELQTHIRGRLPFEYKICAQGLQEVLKYAWSIILQDDIKVNKIATLSLIAQCYKDRLEIATNASSSIMH